MLVFFVTRANDQPLLEFFGTWGRDLWPNVRLIRYEDLATLDRVPGAATYVFTDLERLTPSGRQLSAGLAQQLAESPSSPRVLNHPGQALARYDFLCALHERGINSHRVHRAVPFPREPRYPVFLRDEHQHHVLTTLLFNQQDVERSVVKARLLGHDLNSLLLVEFEDTADADGTYRMYPEYVIGDAFIPGSLSFGSHWMVKVGPHSVSGERLEERRAASTSREHESVLREVAGLGGLAYGRLDFAVVGNRVCIWEMNTNPFLLWRESFYPPDVYPERVPLARSLLAALAVLIDAEHGTGAPDIRVSLREPNGSVTAAAPWIDRAQWVLPRPVRFAARVAEPAARAAILRVRRDKFRGR